MNVEKSHSTIGPSHSVNPNSRNLAINHDRLPIAIKSLILQYFFNLEDLYITAIAIKDRNISASNSL